jgi:3-hydroxybutyryl-CoA dehydratase
MEVVHRPAFVPGQSASFTKTISEADVVLFAGISGDFNPLHIDEEYARQSRFGRRIAHGLLSAGLISRVLGMQLPGPGAIYLKQDLKFLAPVFIGDTITATVEVLSYREDKYIVTLQTDCINQHGQKVLTGEAVLLMDASWQSQHNGRSREGEVSATATGSQRVE